MASGMSRLARRVLTSRLSIFRLQATTIIWNLTNSWLEQLFITNTFSPNIFCHNMLSTSTAIYSQSAENKDKFFIDFYQRVQISGKYRRNYQDQTNRLWVIRHQVLVLSVLRLKKEQSSFDVWSLLLRAQLFSPNTFCPNT